MSYQDIRPNVQAVVCDICKATSWAGDPQWRPMPQSTKEQPIHLCTNCRLSAVWCDAHQQYHLPNTAHRRGCVDCGGLFTSIVRDRVTRCPSCQRAAGDYPHAPTPHAEERPRTFLQRLFSPRAS